MITDERTAVFIQSLDRELPENLKILEQVSMEAYVPIIKRPTQSLLRFLIQSKKPKRILEVGTAVGFSSLLMAEYLPQGGTITTIEKLPKRIALAKQNIKAAKKESVIYLLEGEASILLKKLVKEEKKFDLIFMDAAKGQYLNFLPDILSLLRKDGLLISDNVLQDGEVVESRYAVTRRNRTIHFRMREYLYELTHKKNLDTIILPLGDGVTLSTKLEEC